MFKSCLFYALDDRPLCIHACMSIPCFCCIILAADLGLFESCPNWFKTNPACCCMLALYVVAYLAHWHVVACLSGVAFGMHLVLNCFAYLHEFVPHMLLHARLTMIIVTCLACLHISLGCITFGMFIIHCLLACPCCTSMIACLGLHSIEHASLSSWSTMIEVGGPLVCFVFCAFNIEVAYLTHLAITHWNARLVARVSRTMLL